MCSEDDFELPTNRYQKQMEDSSRVDKFCVKKNPLGFKNLYLPDRFNEQIFEESRNEVLLHSSNLTVDDIDALREHINETSRVNFSITRSSKTGKAVYKTLTCHHGSNEKRKTKGIPYKVKNGLVRSITYFLLAN